MQKFYKNFSAEIVSAPRIQMLILGLIILLSSIYLLLGSAFIYIIVLLINTLYIFASTCRLRLFLIGLRLARTSVKPIQTSKLSDNKLPTYSVLVPLFKEAAVIPNLKKALLELEYPKDKLQVLLIVEEKDFATSLTIDEEAFPKYFHKIIVPFSLPQTKAKACNYGLQFATGEFITIFDAEDRPHPLQLKTVIQEFTNSSQDVACIQCRLCFYNASENWLSKMFALEYATLFDYTLPAVAALFYPVPLGGTSNHIKTHILRSLGGWDSYNVTEDAALGLKIALAGFKTIMIDSYTKEEAPITVNAWIKQRSRWIKGYLHTYLVFIQHPVFLLQKYKIGGFTFFNYFIFLSPFLLIITPLTIYLSVSIINEYDDLGLSNHVALLKYLSIFNLGYGFIQLIFIAYKITNHRIIAIRSLWWTYPFYFFLHIIAAILAVYKLIVEPHKWDKTEHGVTKII